MLNNEAQKELLKVSKFTTIIKQLVLLIEIIKCMKLRTKHSPIKDRIWGENELCYS